MMTREKTLTTDRVMLTVRGEHGVVQAVIWHWSGGVAGVIGIHASAPQRHGQQPENCPVLGRCYDGGSAFRGGHEAAELFEAGQEDAAFAEVEAWYRARLMHEVMA